MGLCVPTTRSSACERHSTDTGTCSGCHRMGDNPPFHKLLLLGAGESGKSTLFKQMIAIYGNGYTKEERIRMAPLIHRTTLSICQHILEYIDTYQRKGTSTPGTTEEITEESESSCDNGAGERHSRSLSQSDSSIEERYQHERLKVLNATHCTSGVISSELAKSIEWLWSDTGGCVRKSWNEFSKDETIDKKVRLAAVAVLPESAEYFINQIDRLACSNYSPTFDDLLRARIRTTGIGETQFNVGNQQFHVYDVGGQRNERRKWIHCFEEITAILFVAALSGYDQVMYEDHQTNRLLEAIELFDEICNSRWFKNTPMILLLNKVDIFREKIDKVPLTNLFPDYKGKTAEEAMDFIGNAFLARNRHPQTRRIYVEYTCATDAKNVNLVFDTVKNIIFNNISRSNIIV